MVLFDLTCLAGEGRGSGLLTLMGRERLDRFDLGDRAPAPAGEANYSDEAAA